MQRSTRLGTPSPPATETTATRAILGPWCGIRLLQLWRENVRASAMAIVEGELLTLPDNVANFPDLNLLKGCLNRTRQAMRPKHPRDLDFELDPDHLPPVFFAGGAVCQWWAPHHLLNPHAAGAAILREHVVHWWHIQSRTRAVCTTAIDPCICATRREREAGTTDILLDVAPYKKGLQSRFPHRTGPHQLTHLGLVSHICVVKNSSHFPSDAYMRRKSLYFSYRPRGRPTRQCQAKMS